MKKSYYYIFIFLRGEHPSLYIFNSLDQMNCCPSADFTFLPNGIEALSKNIQADENKSVFIAFKSIDSINYTYNREEGGYLAIWVKNQCYRYSFPCSEYGREIYKTILQSL